MNVVAEFVLDGYQYQELSNDSWHFPMTGHRRRKLDSNGNAVESWESIHHNEYSTRNAEFHKRKKAATKENWWVNDFKVRVFLKGQLVFETIVRSKAARSAITNVLTNIYRGDMDTATSEQLTFWTEEDR